MEKIQFYKSLNNLTERECIEKFLIYNASLVFSGVKPSATMLKNRYNKFKCPHELGVFLGFPIEDVKDFMNCSNKKCLGCGYWLVYNDIDKARSIFEKYDKIKSYTTRNILKGNSTYKIAYDIKNTFGSLKELDT